MAKKNRYVYAIMTLADARRNDQVVVPNCTPGEAIEVWRYLAGHRKDFPEYDDGDCVVVGVEEDAWLTPKEYREDYAPPEMVCIVRREVWP